MKYKNKDGIELNYTQRNNVQTDLVKEVIDEAISMLEEVSSSGNSPMRAHQRVKIQETIGFLKENFNIEEENGR
tara:strand:- start:50 stop:271 length:222 start_codon:yes stop_codon:yes gene_type:complete